MIHRRRYDLTDDEICVEAQDSLFTFTYKGETAFVVAPQTTPGDIAELFRDSVEVFRVVSHQRALGGLVRISLVGSKGSRRSTYFDAVQLIADHAELENTLEVGQVIDPATQQLAIF